MDAPPLTAPLLEAWLQCERRAWFQRHRPALAAPEDGLERYLHEQRRDLRRLYRRELTRAGGTVVPIHRAGPEAGDATVRALQGTVDVVEGGVFEAPTVGRRATLWLRGEVDGLRRGRKGWRLEALGAGTRVRPHHIRQLAFARHVATAAGVGVDGAAVLHIARRGGRPESRLEARDVTAAVAGAQAHLPRRLEALAASLRAATEPRTQVGPQCHAPRACPFLEHCWQGHHGPATFQVPALRASTRLALRSAGWVDLHRLPPRPPGLTREEARALRDTREGRVRLDLEHLRRGLAELEPPTAYLDLEFATPAVPWLPHMAPFEPLPFQFSVHLEDAAGQVVHRSHLERERDPREPLARALAAALEGAASIVVYDAAGERLLLNVLAESVPELATPLRAAERRTWDLLALIRAAVRHPAFVGGWGLKRVATTLAPGSYADAVLPDGLAAQAAWRRLIRSGESRLTEALLAYCAADSRAMVRVVRVLRRWAEHGNPPPDPER